MYLQARFAAVMSFDLAGHLLGEVLPLGRALHGSAVRDQVTAVARRLEGELGPEQSMFAQGCQRDFDQLPRPDLPLTVGLDGGYVHSSAQTSRRDGWFEVIAAKSMPDEGPAKCFAFVPDDRHQAETAAVRGATGAGHAGQPVRGVPHRWR